MDKFSDDLLSVPREEYKPTTTALLLFHLHLGYASRQDQERGIRDWLAANEPTETLIWSLRRHGFGSLLDRASA